jgi:hypothetical protein
VLRIELPDQPDATIDLSASQCPLVTRALLTALCSLARYGSRLASPGTVRGYANSVRRFDKFLGGSRKDSVELQVVDLTPTDLDNYETELRETASSATSKNPYVKITHIVVLLRELDRIQANSVTPQMAFRLRYNANGEVGEDGKTDAYSATVASRLREAARADVRSAVERIVQHGASVLEEAKDPAKHGFTDPANVLRLIRETGPVSYQTLIAKAGARCGRTHSLRYLHSLIYPTREDILALWIAFSLSTGMEIECVKSLRAHCLEAPERGYVNVRYLKRRRRGHEWNTLRVRDGGITSPGGILRTAQRLTAQAREHLGSDSLWIYYANGRLRRANFTSTQAGTERAVAQRGHADTDHMRLFVKRHGLVDDDGRPLNLVLRRLRKTWKVERYRAVGGDPALWVQGHGVEVAVSHYADLPSMADAHEKAVSDGISLLVQSCTVLTPDQEAQFMPAPEAATAVLERRTGNVPGITGARNVWVADCTNFFESPFAPKGEACPSPVWSCWECKNAVVHSGKLPAVLAFVSMAEDQRSSLTEAEWDSTYARAYTRAVSQILPTYPESVIRDARAIAESDGTVLHLPLALPSAAVRRA